MLTATFFILSLLANSSYARFLSSATELTKDGYDFVIVGGTFRYLIDPGALA